MLLHDWLGSIVGHPDDAWQHGSGEPLGADVEARN
jgi:hypothetical protein